MNGSKPSHPTPDVLLTLQLAELRRKLKPMAALHLRARQALPILDVLEAYVVATESRIAELERLMATVQE